MNQSLNEIVENLAYSLNDQFNMTLREALKHTVSVFREKLLREEDFNKGLNINDFTQNIILPLEDWNHPVCGQGKITKDELPKSVRFKNRGRVNYYFVGDKSFTFPFTQTTFTEFQYLKKLKHQIVQNYYVIENDKLILLDNFKICEIGVQGVFANPNLLKSICSNVEEIDDDAPYPISGDLLAIIRTGIISGNFPVIMQNKEEEGVIKSNSDNNK